MISRCHERTFNTFTKLFVNVASILNSLMFQSDCVYVFTTLSIMSQILDLKKSSYVRKYSQNTIAYYF